MEQSRMLSLSVGSIVQTQLTNQLFYCCCYCFLFLFFAVVGSTNILGHDCFRQGMNSLVRHEPRPSLLLMPFLFSHWYYLVVIWKHLSLGRNLAHVINVCWMTDSNRPRFLYLQPTHHSSILSSHLTLVSVPWNKISPLESFLGNSSFQTQDKWPHLWSNVGVLLPCSIYLCVTDPKPWIVMFVHVSGLPSLEHLLENFDNCYCSWVRFWD